MKAGDCGFAPLMIMSLPACCAQESSDSDKDMPDLVEVIMNPPRANFDPWWMVRFWKLFGGQTRLTIYVRIIVYIYIYTSPNPSFDGTYGPASGLNQIPP